MKFTAKFTSTEQAFNAKFAATEQAFNAKFAATEQAFNAKFSNFQLATEYVDEEYEGEYSVTPKVEAQTMPTKDKAMAEDVTIKAIPYAEVTNLAKGKTVTIA